MPKSGLVTVAEVMSAARGCCGCLAVKWRSCLCLPCRCARSKDAVAVYAARRMVFNRPMRNRDDDLATIDLRCWSGRATMG